MIRLSLPLLALTALACGPSSSSSSPSADGTVLTIEVDGEDFGAVDFSASVSSTTASTWRLSMGGMRPHDPDIADDEMGIYATFIIDDLFSRQAGDTIVVDAVTTFEAPEDLMRGGPKSVTSTGRSAHDADVRSAYVQVGCYCGPDPWWAQTITATLSVTAVSGGQIEGEIEMTAEGGLPYYDFVFQTENHVTEISGTFVAD
ncbi:MAG: hypothetical protein RMA76_32300 [Deltaproteobacteria bacterium]|jgi:hypothetical protein